MKCNQFGNAVVNWFIMHHTIMVGKDWTGNHILCTVTDADLLICCIAVVCIIVIFDNGIIQDTLESYCGNPYIYYFSHRILFFYITSKKHRQLINVDTRKCETCALVPYWVPYCYFVECKINFADFILLILIANINWCAMNCTPCISLLVS